MPGWRKTEHPYSEVSQPTSALACPYPPYPPPVTPPSQISRSRWRRRVSVLRKKRRLAHARLIFFCSHFLRSESCLRLNPCLAAGVLLLVPGPGWDPKLRTTFVSFRFLESTLDSQASTTFVSNAALIAICVFLK